jgi:hypothetical protein
VLTSSTSVTREFFSSARRRSLLLIAVRPRNFTIRCLLLYFPRTPALPFPMVAPVPAHISKLPRRKLSYRSRHSRPNSRPVNLLQPLFPCSVAPVLCFQQLAASFPKIPGWGVPLRNLPDLCSLPRLPRASRGASKGALSFAFVLVRSSWRFLCPPLTTFRMNTCKSVSKQSTLTIFRMNTYEKQGEGGGG